MLVLIVRKGKRVIIRGNSLAVPIATAHKTYFKSACEPLLGSCASVLLDRPVSRIMVILVLDCLVTILNYFLANPALIPLVTSHETTAEA